MGGRRWLAIEDLQREAAASGFQADTLEKAIRLRDPHIRGESGYYAKT
jgi:hypothetical protein